MDLSATLRGGPGAEVDLLDGPRDLERWLDERGLARPGLALRLADFRLLRSAIRSLLIASAAGHPLPAAAVEALNGASAAAPAHASLDLGGGSPRAIEVAAGSDAAVVLASIAGAAIRTLGGPDRERLRVCPAPRCGLVFLADRPRQVWCSNACGNRVRVARHHARRRAPTPLEGPSTLRA
jgi:predicted RNA-binding Zn ribbon-like protein